MSYRADTSSGPSGVCVLRAYGLTDQGRVRPTNEDCFAIQEALGLCVVADGMGGHNAGEVAARLAVDALVHFVGAGSDQGRIEVRPQSDSRPLAVRLRSRAVG